MKGDRGPPGPSGFGNGGFMDLFKNQDQKNQIPSATPSPLTPPDLSEEAHKYRQSQEQGEVPFLSSEYEDSDYYEDYETEEGGEIYEDYETDENNDNLDDKGEKGKLTQSCFELRVAHTRRLASPLGSHTRSHPPG